MVERSDVEDGEMERAARVARFEFEKLFEEMPEAGARTRYFNEKIKYLVDDEEVRGVLSNFTDISTLSERFEKVARLDKKEEFVDAAVREWANLYRCQRANLELFARFQRRRFVEANKFAPVNHVLSYGRENEELHIHLADAADLSLGEKLKALREGFADLAQLIEANPGVKTVSATSWIVAEHPGILEKLGFTVEGGEIGPELHVRHFQNEKRPVRRAFIDREEFLKRYLPKQ